jgi:hypothetical protein
MEDINHSEIAIGFCLPDSNPRIFLSRAILARPPECILDLIFPHLMLVDVRNSSLFINVETNLHLRK